MLEEESDCLGKGGRGDGGRSMVNLSGRGDTNMKKKGKDMEKKKG